MIKLRFKIGIGSEALNVIEHTALRRIDEKPKLTRILSFLIAPLAFLTIFGGPAALAASESPTGSGDAQAAVAAMIESIRNLGQTKDQVKRGQIIDSIDNSLAIEAMAQQALGQTWQTLTKPQRIEFVGLIRQTLEKLAYPRASDFFTGLQIEYRGVASSAKGEIVKTRVTRPESGQVEIDYLMERRGGRWRATNINLDGASLTDGVTNQVQAVLKQSSYAELVQKMKARLAEVSSASGFDGQRADCA